MILYLLLVLVAFPILVSKTTNAIELAIQSQT